MTVRSSLACTAASQREPDPAKGFAEAKAAWHEHGIALLRPTWFTSWADQKQVEILADKLFGARKGKA